MSIIIIIEEKLIAQAFTEWDRRYREDPEAFQNEAARLMHSDAETYGEQAAPYFISVLTDVSGE